MGQFDMHALYLGGGGALQDLFWTFECMPDWPFVGSVSANYKMSTNSTIFAVLAKGDKELAISFVLQSTD